MGELHLGRIGDVFRKRQPRTHFFDNPRDNFIFDIFNYGRSVANESAGLKKSGQFFQSEITYRLDVLAIEVIHIGPFFPVLTILFPRMPHM